MFIKMTAIGKWKEPPKLLTMKMNYIFHNFLYYCTRKFCDHFNFHAQVICSPLSGLHMNLTVQHAFTIYS